MKEGMKERRYEEMLGASQVDRGGTGKMNKLKIEQCELINPHWYAIRFSGDHQAFEALTSLLARQRAYNAYWDAARFEGRGGWIVSIGWIRHYSQRFHNLERAVTLAKTQWS